MFKDLDDIEFKKDCIFFKQESEFVSVCERRNSLDFNCAGCFIYFPDRRKEERITIAQL